MKGTDLDLTAKAVLIDEDPFTLTWKDKTVARRLRTMIALNMALFDDWTVQEDNDEISEVCNEGRSETRLWGGATNDPLQDQSKGYLLIYISIPPQILQVYLYSVDQTIIGQQSSQIRFLASRYAVDPYSCHTVLGKHQK